MERKLALLLGVLLLLPLAHFFGADLQVKAIEAKNSDPKRSDDSGSRGKASGGLNSGANNNSRDGIVEGNKDDRVGVDGESKLSSKTNPKNVANTRKIDAGSDNQKKNIKTKKLTEKASTSDQVDESKKGSGKDYDSELGSDERKNSEGTVGSKENAENKGRDDHGNDLKGDGNREAELGEDNDRNDTVEKHIDDNLGSAKDESSSGSDDCYSSYKCSDKENELIACLRVPGNDSPHLSLLVQNKGNDSITVDISAPDFVRLESTRVQLQKRENKQVEVSIGNGGKQSLIVLTSGNRVCNLDFKDLMTSHKYLRLPARRPTLAFLSFSALLIAGSAWMCLRSRRRKLSSRNVVAYQNMDSGLLPVTNDTSPKQVSSSTNGNGWDESWGDDWDDEEVPQTPSKPSPSFSSKRLVSRRLSKEN